MEKFLEEYSPLEIEDIYACFDYAASLAKKQITPIEMIESGVRRSFKNPYLMRHIG
jgi:hypothetical protein